MFTRPAKILRPPLAVPPRPGPAPRSPSHLPGLWVTRHQRGFTHVRPSGLPLACAPGWNGTRFGFFPELRTPRLPATHVRAGTGLEHWPGATSPTSPALQSTQLTRNMRPRVARPQPSHPPRTAASVLPSTMSKPGSSLRENNQRPNKTVLTPAGGHDIPAAINSPGHRQGHDLSAGLEALGTKVLTCRRPPGTESAVWRTRQLLLARCSRRPDRRSRTSTFGTAEGPITEGAVCSLKPLTRPFGPKAPGSLKSELGVGFRGRVFSEARVPTLGGPAARSPAPLLSRENIANCGFRAYPGCTPDRRGQAGRRQGTAGARREPRQDRQGPWRPRGSRSAPWPRRSGCRPPGCTRS